MNEINEDLKKCSKCEMECLKSNFDKITKTSHGFHSQCKFCRKKLYDEKLVKVKKCYLDKRDRKREY